MKPGPCLKKLRVGGEQMQAHGTSVLVQAADARGSEAGALRPERGLACGRAGSRARSSLLSSSCALLPASPTHSASLRPPVQPAGSRVEAGGGKEGGPEPLPCGLLAMG